MRRGSCRGFTLIELMIVIAIIGIIAAIALPNLLSAKVASNETAAIATLRNLVSAQAQIAVSGKIDADQDGKGEYGTFLELSGAVGVRTGYSPGPPGTVDFTRKGEQVNPPVLSAIMKTVDANGFATKAGYAVVVFLPDAGSPAGFAREVGPAGNPTLTAPVGVDMSENVWCAYAQPVATGNTGNRRFFTNQKGDILHSANDGQGGLPVFQGTSTAVVGNSAFLGTNITSPVAIGSTGQDGYKWKVAN